MPTDSTATKRRTYRSPRREAQTRETRAALIAAASELFPARGWAATGMRDLAQHAGVATETLYKHFSSKANLLLEAIDVAIVGDDAPVPVAGRDTFAALGEGTRAQRLDATATLVAGIHERAAGFARVLREAAPTDERIAALQTEIDERRRRDVARAAALVMGRVPTDDERDSFWALVSVDVYLLLVENSGWSVEKYRSWVARTLDAITPPT